MRLGLGLGMGVSAPARVPAFVATTYAGNTIDLNASVGYASGTWTDPVSGRSVTQAGGTARPTATTVGGFAALDFDGSNDYLTGTDITVIATNSAYTFLAVAWIDAIDSSAAASVHNDGILTTANGVIGFCLKNTPALFAGQFDGGFKQDSQTVGTGALTLLGARFGGGTIKASVNGVDGAGAASGNVSVFSGAWDVGRAGQGPNYFDGKLLRLITYNVALSDANWAAAKTALMIQYGITA